MVDERRAGLVAGRSLSGEGWWVASQEAGAGADDWRKSGVEVVDGVDGEGVGGRRSANGV